MWNYIEHLNQKLLNLLFKCLTKIFMNKYELVSGYKPAGDQPKAIKELVEGVKQGEKFQTLLGVTGSGKTFTISNLIKEINKPFILYLL